MKNLIGKQLGITTQGKALETRYSITKAQGAKQPDIK
jgi:hypothetical protein